MISLTSPVKTRAHGWPAGAKLGALSVATVVLFLLRDPLFQLGVFAFTLCLYALPGSVFFKAGMRRLWVLWPFVAIILIWHVATARYAEGIVTLLRLLSAVGLANLVTMTTALQDMIAVIHWLTAPLRRLGLNSRAFEMAMALVVRLVPVLLEKGQGLTQAWRARSARRPSWRIILPFTLVALDDADHIAEALKARGGLSSPKER